MICSMPAGPAAATIDVACPQAPAEHAAAAGAPNQGHRNQQAGRRCSRACTPQRSAAFWFFAHRDQG